MLLLAYRAGDPASLICDDVTLQTFPAAAQSLRPKTLNVPDRTESLLYGKFDNVPIPPTPASRIDRQRLLAQAAIGGTAGGTG